MQDLCERAGEVLRNIRNQVQAIVLPLDAPAVPESSAQLLHKEGISARPLGQKML